MFPGIKQAAVGRCGEIIAALTPLSAEITTKGRTDHPCPVCGGNSVIWPDDRDGGADQHGRIACRNCTGGNPTTDIIDTVRVFGGHAGQGEAARAIMDHLGLDAVDAFTAKQPKVDIVAAVATAKRMPLEAFKLFGAKEAERGRKRDPVARVPVFNDSGEVHSHFDITPKDKGFFKRGKGSSGLFLPGRSPKAGETWCIVEGVKDAAALTGMDYHACGAPTSYLAAKYAELFRGVDVILVPDLDRPGQDGATRSGGHLAGIAASVRIARLPGEIVETGGADVRDCIARHGADTVRSAIDAAEPWQPRDGDAPKDDRPEVMLTLRHARHIPPVIKHLGKLGWDTPWVPASEREESKVYHRSGQLVEVVEQTATGPTSKKSKLRIAAGTPRIRPLPLQQLPLRITDACRLVVEKGSDEEVEIVEVPPPRWLVEGVHTTGGYGDAIRPLEGIVTAPTIRPNGSVLQSPGWDAETGLIFRPSIDYPEIPEEPTQADAAAAAAELLGVVEDFPFLAPADRSAWLAMLLSMIARPCIPGCVPLFGVGANIRGSGKSKLCDVTSLIAFGHDAARSVYTTDDREMRKVITTVAKEAPAAILLDNIDQPLRGAAMDAVLTATRWRDRDLGANQSVDLPIRTVWTATGNNLTYASDVARRVVPIRLDSPMERPEDRTGFRHADLEGWVRANRPNLVVAALSIVRAYFVADCPTQPGGTFGSYEGWASTIRAAIVWAGLADPMTTRETAAQDDRSADIVRGLIGGLLEIDDSGEGLTCREICERLNCPTYADRYPTMRDAVAETATVKNSADAKKLGYVLRKYQGRASGGFKIYSESARAGTKKWSVCRAYQGGGDGGDSGDVSLTLTREAVCHTGTHVTHTHTYIREGETSQPSHPSPPSPPSTGQEVEL